MKGALRRFVESTPGVRGIYWRTLAPWVESTERRRWAAMTTRDVFTDIYRRNRWLNAESRSGAGSTLSETEAIREQLPGLWERWGIRRVLDVPCGDFHWMQHVDLSRVQYVGGDIVEELVQANQRRYGSDRVSFIHCDLLKATLPPADMVMVRDCLVHMSLSDAMTALGNIRRSGIRYLLTTTFTKVAYNTEIVTGEWRSLNLERPPFAMPAARDYLVETRNGKACDGGKALGLWEMG